MNTGLCHNNLMILQLQSFKYSQNKLLNDCEQAPVARQKRTIFLLMQIIIIDKL